MQTSDKDAISFSFAKLVAGCCSSVAVAKNFLARCFRITLNAVYKQCVLVHLFIIARFIFSIYKAILFINKMNV